MILTGKLYKMRYCVGASVKTPLVIHAESMDAADAEVMLYASAQEDYHGEPVRILSATEIDVAGL